MAPQQPILVRIFGPSSEPSGDHFHNQNWMLGGQIFPKHDLGTLDLCMKGLKINRGNIARGKSNLQILQMPNSVKLSFLDTLYV